MEYNRIVIGKVRTWNDNTGVGEIVTSNNSFMFTLDDLNSSSIRVGDLVKFRAEKIHDTNRAHFVHRIAKNFELTPVKIEGKTYKRRGNG